MSSDISDLVGNNNSQDTTRRSFIEGFVAAATLTGLGLSGTASAEEPLPYNGPTIAYNGTKLPDLDGKEFGIAPYSRSGSSTYRYKIRISDDEITIITTTGTNVHGKDAVVVTAKMSYNPRTNMYDLVNGKFYFRDPRDPTKDSVDLMIGSVIGSDKTGKSIIDISFRLVSGPPYNPILREN